MFNDSHCALNTCKADEELVFALGGGKKWVDSGLFQELNTEFVTNVDGSGFDHEAHCGPLGGNSAGNSNNGNGGNSHNLQCCGE